MADKTDALTAAVLELLRKIGVPCTLHRQGRGVLFFQVTPPGEGANVLEERVRKLAELAVDLD